MEFQLNFHILYFQCFPFLILLTTQKSSLKMGILIFSILKVMLTIHHTDLYLIWHDMVCNPIHLFLLTINSFINQFLGFRRCVKRTKLPKKIYLVRLSQHPWAILQGMNLFNAFVLEKQGMKVEIASNVLSAAFHIICSVWKLRNPLLSELFAHYVY